MCLIFNQLRLIIGLLLFSNLVLAEEPQPTLELRDFDRFLVDVFYLPGCDDAERIAREGILLNQELIDEGLADLWQTVDPNEMAFLN